MQIIKSIIAGLLFSIFIIITTSFIVSFVYEDEISALFIKELNKRIDADIETESVNLSLLQKFPGASVELENFQLQSTVSQDTSLSFQADKVFFQFDILDIFTKKVIINKINIQDGHCEMRTDRPIRLRNNFQKNKKITLSLNKLTFSNFDYIISNNNKNFSISGTLNRTTITGNISSNESTLDIESKSFINFLNINNFSYIKNKNIELSIGVFTSPDIYQLKKGELELEDLPLHINGTYNRNNDELSCSLQGKSIKISDIKFYIPWHFREQYDNILLSKGRISLFARAQGKVKKAIPSIAIEFQINNGKVEVDDDNSLDFNNINFDGYFANGRLKQPATSYVILENFKTDSKYGSFKGKVELTDFVKPILKISGAFNSELAKIDKTLEIPELQKAGGSLEGNIALETSLNKPLNLLKLIDQKQLSGDLTLKNASFVFKKYSLYNLDVFAYMDNSIIHLENINGLINHNNEINFSGKISHLEDYFMDSTKTVSIEGRLNSKALHINQLLKPDTSSAKFKLPGSIKSNILLNIKNLSWNKFSAKNFQGRLQYKPRKLSFNSVSLKTLDGSGKLNIQLSKNPDQSFQLSTHAFLDHINIQRTFNVFDDFGQDYINENNLKGFINGEFFLGTKLDTNLKIQTESLNNICDFSIHDGELINFEPLNKLSSFIELSELQHIHFSRLENKITIKDQVVQIPEMVINSSAIDLKLEGFHRFNRHYNYKVNLLLSELLSKKADKKVHKYGTVAEDGVGRTRLFLILENKGGKTNIRYDKEGVKTKIKEDIKKEKKDMKKILNEEFGLFKSDTSLEHNQSTNGQDFEIEWEKDSTEKKKKSSKKKKKTKSKFIIKWEEDTLKSY